MKAPRNAVSVGRFATFWLPVALLIFLPGCDPAGDDMAWARGETRAPQKSAVQASPAAAPLWKRLAEDGLHDPTNPDLVILQQPEEALSVLPRAQDGNNVDWVEALESGFINPRTNIYPETKTRIIDLDILMEDTAGMPMVLFPHRAHTEWLDCSNCHNRIFIAERGANPVNMLAILQGYYCGQCHGAVSFPLTQCARCHSIQRPGLGRPSGAEG